MTISEEFYDLLRKTRGKLPSEAIRDLASRYNMHPNAMATLVFTEIAANMKQKQQS